ncbi:MAG TPA: hypothetical protein VHA73_06755 [Acidimicrobiales bacterium]|jgi:hypothetical protein|nr:hypothetical protein [Acidimicrobiales bacterium]
MSDRLRPLAVTVLGALTLAMWTGRLGLAWGTGGSSASKLWATVPVVVFVVAGMAALAVVVRTPGPHLAARDRTLARVVAWWTIFYWVVRLPVIWFDGRSVGFKGVHTVLALVSWAAAGWTIRSLRSVRRRDALANPA